MSQVTDAIYDAINALIQDPTKFTDMNFMMSIFDKWLKKFPGLSGKFGCSYIPKFADWWEWTYLSGRKTKYIENGNTQVFVMTEVLDLCFDPDDDAMKETTEVVHTLAFEGNCQWRDEMVNKKKATSEHMTCVQGTRSWNAISEKEKQAGRGIRATNDVAESPFAIVKEQKRRYGPRLSILKAGGHALITSNGYLVRTVPGDSRELGYFHKLPKYEQDSIIIYAEEQVRAAGADNKRALEAFGAHKLKRFEEDLKKQQGKELEEYNKALVKHSKIYTSECFRTEEEINEGLLNVSSEPRRKDILKDQFKYWEVGAGWNKKHAPATAEFSKDGTIQKAADKTLWPHVYQPYSRKRVQFLSAHLELELKKSSVNKYKLEDQYVHKYLLLLRL